MNKQEKLIAILLGLGLVGWLVSTTMQQRKAAATAARTIPAAAQSSARPASDPVVVPKPAAPAVTVPKRAPVVSHAPEQIVALSNAQMVVRLSTRGAVIKSATLLEYAEKTGPISVRNPALTLDFSASPALALEGLAAQAEDADWKVAESGENFVAFASPLGTRRVTLGKDYRLTVKETFASAGPAPHGLSLGAMAMGSSKNDILSIDSYLTGIEKPHVVHHGDTDPLKGYLTGTAGGCSGSKDATGIPVEQRVTIPGEQGWVAVKNRFFVTALCGASARNEGFVATMTRDSARRDYVLKHVAASVKYAELPSERTYTLFVGPKKQSLLWDLGMREVMEFGMWKWFCYPIVWILNACNAVIPSYGIAIILLTVLVRLVFWPLTHKSTVSMRKMQEIQPIIKDIQKRFKDNPQRLQQETFAAYREHKVNPMASCLPMLIQIPVFIALFNVLRAAVELRYAPFLWIADLSEPEALFASWFPFGGLNILPILMAATMALQSALTPSTGDKNQQRMMMVMMPLMMLVMFYSFPSALSLYWTLSQVVSIAQMWWIRKKYTPAPAAKDGVVVPDAVEMPETRQMRRHR